VDGPQDQLFSMRKSQETNDRIYGGIKYYHSWDKDGEAYVRKE